MSRCYSPDRLERLLLVPALSEGSGSVAAPLEPASCAVEMMAEHGRWVPARGECVSSITLSVNSSRSDSATDPIPCNPSGAPDVDCFMSSATCPANRKPQTCVSLQAPCLAHVVLRQLEMRLEGSLDAFAGTCLPHLSLLIYGGYLPCSHLLCANRTKKLQHITYSNAVNILLIGNAGLTGVFNSHNYFLAAT